MPPCTPVVSDSGGHDAPARVAGRTVARPDDAVPRFEATDVGVTTVDPIERKRQVFLTDPAPPDVREVTPAAVPAPVERAVAVDADELSLPRLSVVLVRDGEWDLLTHLEEGADERFGPGEYVLDLSGPIKHYLHVRGTFRVRTGEGTSFSFEPGTDVVLAARSKHERPATTLTVPPDPAGVREAISTFGAALKTTAPDRSWPNLRGHPPAVEVGDELSIPDGHGPPVPEIRIEVPTDYEHLFPVATLAYYLGARVVAADGGRPRIATESGFSYPLDEGGFERAVERTVKQVVFLECLVRSEGIIQLPLHERRAVDLGLDFERVYGQPPAVRLGSLLSVDYDRIADHVPDWSLTSYLAPRPGQVEMLPYVLDDLAVVRTKGDPPVGSRTSHAADGRADPGVGTGGFVQLDDDPGSIVEAWSGQGTPIGAGKLQPEAYRNRFDVEPDDPPIDVAVVCNDPAMDEELGVESVYGGATVPLDVSVYRSLSTTALRTLIDSGDVDFLHYIGHADREGLRCRDGRLDLHSLASTDLQAFFLNACASYNQAIALVEAGAIGGLATREDVVNTGAVEMGGTLARLLNTGYSLRAAVSLARETELLGRKYIVVGYGGHTLVQPKNDTITRYDVDPGEDESFRIASRGFPGPIGIGGAFHPYHESFDYHLLGNRTPEVELTAEELTEFLNQGPVPVRIRDGDSRLVWSHQLDVGSL